MNGPTQDQIDPVPARRVPRRGAVHGARGTRARARAVPRPASPTSGPPACDRTRSTTRRASRRRTVARQLCNVWKSGHRSWPPRRCRSATAAGARSSRRPPGCGCSRDNMIWKPPGSKALLGASGRRVRDVHRAAEHDVVLDRARRHARGYRHDLLRPGSNHWPRSAPGGQFHAPDDWTGYLRSVVPRGVRRRRRVGADRGAGRLGAARSTTAGAGTARRRTSGSTVSAGRSSLHMVTTETRWHETNRHEIYSRYMRPGELEMEEAFYPIMYPRGRLPDALHRPRLRAARGRGVSALDDLAASNAELEPDLAARIRESGVEHSTTSSRP